MHTILYIKNFLRSWLLPTAMVAGTLIYLLFAYAPCLQGVKPAFLQAAEILMPTAIFLILFFTFCRIRIADMKPRGWHLATLSLQAALSVGCALFILKILHPSTASHFVAEGVLACLLSPTAAAAAVITDRLGGSAASLTSYTLESNVLSALLITLICPLVHPIAGLHIVAAFARVLLRVSALLILPFLASLAVKMLWPRLHARLAAMKDLAFYMWGVSLTMVTGMTMRVVFGNLSRPHLVACLMAGALIVCIAQFAVGKAIGSRTGHADMVSAGQAFGQKNTMFTIWMALTYLSPVAAVAPGSYVVWQNIVNSWQLRRMERGRDKSVKTHTETAETKIDRKLPK